MQNMTKEEKAGFGSMLGAFVGDSIGSYLEFKMDKQEPREIWKGMNMNGGGIWKLAAG